MSETDTAPQEQPRRTPELGESLIDNSEQYSMLKNPYDRMEYVHLTDGLVHRLEGGEEGPKPDFVIFLDKSARPVSWLTRELWNDLAREPGTAHEDNVIPERPKFVYLNIDSKHMFDRGDIPGLRSLFTVDEVESLEGIDEKPTYFDDKNILIVDEIGVSHATSVKAQKYVELAFPAAKVDTYTWMDQGPATNYGGAGAPPTFDIDTMQFSALPINPGMPRKNLDNNLRWYKDRSFMGADIPLELKRKYDDGRAVIDRDAATEEETAQQVSNRTKFGKQWLSIMPAEILPESKGLLKDIALIGKEFREKKLPYWPSHDREDYSERVESHNNVDVRSFTKFREWFKKTWWSNFEDAPVIIDQLRPIGETEKTAKKYGEQVVRFARGLGLVGTERKD